jgi:catechol 2,3-dioxygenase-like lactoylglutathione lyase family enzyme
MFDHISIGARDVAASRRFYDAALAPLGYPLRHGSDSDLCYGTEASVFLVSKTEHAAFVLDPDGYRIEAYCGRPN